MSEGKRPLRLFMRLMRQLRNRHAPEPFGPHRLEVRNYPNLPGEMPIALVEDLIGWRPGELVVPPTDRPLLLKWYSMCDGGPVNEEGQFIGIAVDAEPQRLRSGSVLLAPSNKARIFRLASLK